VGVALSNDPMTDLGGLLEAADQALYRAKEAGLNSFRLRRPVGLSIQKRSAA